MNFEWKEKVCLVTGASGGIGLALVKAFLSRGAKCLMTDINYKVCKLFTIIKIFNTFFDIYFSFKMVNKTCEMM